MIPDVFPKQCAGRYSQGWFEGWGGVAVSYTWEMEVEEAQSSSLVAVSPESQGADSRNGQQMDPEEDLC